MSNEAYPCMLYRLDDSKDSGAIVYSRVQYLAMAGYSDPFGIRNVEPEIVCPAVDVVQKAKPGRKPKVQS